MVRLGSARIAKLENPSHSDEQGGRNMYTVNCHEQYISSGVRKFSNEKEGSNSRQSQHLWFPVVCSLVKETAENYFGADNGP
jgi:hypothetical protein